jgi:hypothetical protein
MCEHHARSQAYMEYCTTTWLAGALYAAHDHSAGIHGTMHAHNYLADAIGPMRFQCALLLQLLCHIQPALHAAPRPCAVNGCQTHCCSSKLGDCTFLLHAAYGVRIANTNHALPAAEFILLEAMMAGSDHGSTHCNKYEAVRDNPPLRWATCPCAMLPLLIAAQQQLCNKKPC